MLLLLLLLLLYLVGLTQQVDVPLVLEALEGRLVKGKLFSNRFPIGRKVIVEQLLDHRSFWIQVFVNSVYYLIGEDLDQIVPGTGGKEIRPEPIIPAGKGREPPFLLVAVVVVTDPFGRRCFAHGYRHWTMNAPWSFPV